MATWAGMGPSPKSDWIEHRGRLHRGVREVAELEEGRVDHPQQLFVDRVADMGAQALRSRSDISRACARVITISRLGLARPVSR